MKTGANRVGRLVLIRSNDDLFLFIEKQPTGNSIARIIPIPVFVLGTPGFRPIHKLGIALIDFGLFGRIPEVVDNMDRPG